IPKSKSREATKVAIDVDFRHVNSAFLCQNGEKTGKALREKMEDGTVKREDILIYTMKPAEELVPKDANGETILHTVEFCDIWEIKAGLTKTIELSNFNHKQLEMILNKPELKYRPICNQ
ncbi:hypothetical protein HPG69_008432, partial [Diceros bicornis minor]